MAGVEIGRRTVVTALAGSLAVPALGARLAQPARPVVEIRDGRLRGIAERGALAFKGIPYGAPTGGANRFLPPRPPRRWAGIRDASDYGAYAPQLLMGPPNPRLAGYSHQLINREAAGASEDCLHLNVWTPAADGRRRPVIVWCHGGGFLIRSGGSAVNNGASLARHQELVVVTLNHRLNVFGFLDLSDVGGPNYAASGNVGMLDIVAALEWVRDNIAAFGGDPGNVTIFGQSGGAGKVSTLLAMPAAKGLFHRAIMESGASPRVGTHAEAAEMTSLVLQEGGGSLAALRALSAEQLTAAAKAGFAKWATGRTLVGNIGFLPVVDGHVLPAQPFDPRAPEASAGVPVMLGYTSTEMTYYDDWHTPIDDATLTVRAQRQIGRDPTEVIAAFRSDRPGASPAELAMLIATQAFTGVNTIAVAEARAAQARAPTFMYVFAWETPVLNMRAPHTIEIPFVFHNLDIAENMVGPLGPETRRLEQQMSGVWAAFARSGDPDHRGLPHWPAYDLAARPVMMFGGDSAVRSDPWSAERKALMPAARGAA